jgi:hypothetical protein
LPSDQKEYIHHSLHGLSSWNSVHAFTSISKKSL